MLDLIIQNMSIVWLVLMVLLFIIEAATAGLTVIWFALGALAADVYKRQRSTRSDIASSTAARSLPAACSSPTRS